MKDSSFILKILTSIIICSCSIADIEPEIQDSERIDVCEITATFKDFSKVNYGDGGKVSWSKGDHIRYFTEDQGEIGTFVVEEDCETATFKVPVTESTKYITAIYGGGEISRNYLDRIIINEVIPGVQSGSFSDGHVATATCNIQQSQELAFENVIGFIKFSFDRDDIRFVSLTSNSGEPIAHSKHMINLYQEKPEIMAYSLEGSATIYVPVSGSGTFYISLCPTTFTNGFTIQCYDAEMEYLGTVSTQKTFSLSRNEVLNLGTLDSRMYNENLRFYHTPGPASDSTAPDPDDIDNIIIPGMEGQPTDPSSHIYICSDGSAATVSYIEEKESYFITFCTNLNAADAKERTLCMHADRDGKILQYITEDKTFNVNYTDNTAEVSFNDANGDIHVIKNISNPYLGEIPSHPSGIYRSLIGPAFEILLNDDLCDYIASPIINGIAAWSSRESPIAESIINSALQTGLLFYKTTLESDYILQIGSSKKISLVLVKSAKLLSRATFYGLAASILLENLNMCMEIISNHEANMRTLLYGNASPVTMSWEQTGRYTVTTYCCVNDKAITDTYNIGIIVGNTVLLTKRFNDFEQHELADGTTVHSFTFSGLKADRTYYYRAVLIPIEDYDSTLYDYWKYGEINTFNIGDYYLSESDLGLSVIWSTCNIGASQPWERGDYLTFEQATKAASGTGWRIPTYKEFSELFSNNMEKKEDTTINDINGVKITNNGNSIFLPKAGTYTSYNMSGFNSYGYYWSTTTHPNSSYPLYQCMYFSGTGGGSYWTSDWGLMTLRLVKDR